MAGAYSTDLRERVLLAMEGGATPEAVARRFAVGRSTAYRWLEAALRGVLAESNRLSLAECRDRLAERTGVHVHLWTVGRALRRMGWT
jgi:transposase